MAADAYAKYEVRGDEKLDVCRRIETQVRQWGLKLPDVTFLVLHFGLGNFFSTGETEYWVANEASSGYCAKLIFVFEGQTCPYHHHRIKHETFYVLKGKALMVIDGKELVLAEGAILPMTVGTWHSFRGEGGPCLLLEASMPSVPGDSYFENMSIGTNGRM